MKFIVVMVVAMLSGVVVLRWRASTTKHDNNPEDKDQNEK